jgi:Xaa-Pro aminopeptidase
MNRADRVAERLRERELDLLLVTDGTNLRYLTGFTGTNGMAVVGTELRRFVTDFRYVEQAAVQVIDFDREQGPQDFVTALKTGWPEGDLRLGFEDSHLSVRQHRRIREVVPERIELVPAGEIVEAERAVKEPGELDSIRAAARLADDVYDWLREWGIVGRTEREVGVALEHQMRMRGASDPSFPSIVASGERGALPHAVRSDEPIRANALVTLDIGAVLDGYCSDCTRTWATGSFLPSSRRSTFSSRGPSTPRRGGACRAHGARSGRRGARHDRRGGTRRALRPWPRPRGRHGRPRGAAAGADGQGRARRGQRGDGRTGRLPPGVGGVRIEDLVVVIEGGLRGADEHHEGPHRRRIGPRPGHLLKNAPGWADIGARWNFEPESAQSRAALPSRPLSAQSSCPLLPAPPPLTRPRSVTPSSRRSAR